MDEEYDVLCDIRGDKCPMTYIKARITLEDLKPQQVMLVLIDYAPAVDNLRRNFTMEGQQVYGIEQVGPGEWKLRVRKLTA